MPRYAIVVETDATSTGIWLPDIAGLLEDIDAAARLAGLTRSAYLASAAREKMRAG